MSTVSTTNVNDGVDGGLWVTVSELARMKGVDKSGLSRRVARFEGQGEQITRPGDRGTKLVNVAAYDRLVGETGDIFRAQAPTASKPPPPALDPSDAPDADPARASLATEQARRVSYQAELARLDLEERLGALVPVTEVADAMAKCARAIVRSIDRLPSRTDDLCAAVAKEGTTGGRRFLRDVAHDLRKTLEREMRLLEKSNRGASIAGPDEGEDKPA